MQEISTTQARSAWIDAFVSEWTRLASGQADPEQLREQASILVCVVGEWPAEDAARKHFSSFPLPEDRIRDPESQFAALAADAGIIKPGDTLDRNQVEFAFGVVELCASAGDQYGDDVVGNAGEHIRSLHGRV